MNNICLLSKTPAIIIQSWHHLPPRIRLEMDVFVFSLCICHCFFFICFFSIIICDCFYLYLSLFQFVFVWRSFEVISVIELSKTPAIIIQSRHHLPLRIITLIRWGICVSVFSLFICHCFYLFLSLFLFVFVVVSICIYHCSICICLEEHCSDLSDRVSN